MNYPNPPIQSTVPLQWHRKDSEAGRANRILAGTGYKIRRTTKGLVLQISGGGRASPFSTWHLKEVKDEYLLCRSWDGENEGDEDMKIAKPGKLRSSVDQEIIDGETVNYPTYDATKQTRHAIKGTAPDTVEEDQVIVPRYLVDDVITAMSVKSLAVDEDGKDIFLLDCNENGRAWAAT